MPAQTGLLSNPMLALLPPDQQQNLLQLQQRQAIGQSLLQQGLTPLDTSNRQVGGMAYHISPLEGISKTLNAYLGNKISMDSMGQQAGLMSNMFGNAFGVSQPQQAPAPQGTTPNPFDAGGMTDGQSGAGVQSAPVPTPGAQPSPQQIGAAMGGSPVGAPQQSQGGALTLPGKTPQQSMQIFSIVGPEAYGKMLSEWSGPTAATKAAQQGGMDPVAANRLQFTKDAYIPPVQVGANTMVMDPRTGASSTTPAAAPAGAQNIQGVDGKWYTVPVAGGIQANQAASAADAAGKAQYAVRAGFDSSGKPTFTTDAAIANGNVPGAPGQQPVTAGRFGGYQAPGAGPVAPGLAPGVADAAGKVAGANADRYNTAVQFGVDSPMRQNVLDNIINLSKAGVATGPNQSWVNAVKGGIADTPGLGSLPGVANWKDDVSGFSEIKKYITQNGQRAWQSAGGTGTDSQLATAQNANPNDSMFPQALQHMAAWAKAGELAGTARANFLQQYKNNNGGVANLDQAEQTWRNNFDPKVYQLQTYPPDQQQSMINSLSPADAAALMQKRAWAKQNGLLQ